MSDINISMIEFILFMWGALATAAALQYREERKQMVRLLQHIIENKTVRDNIVAAHEEFVDRINKEYNK